MTSYSIDSLISAISTKVVDRNQIYTALRSLNIFEEGFLEILQNNILAIRYLEESMLPNFIDIAVHDRVLTLTPWYGWDTENPRLSSIIVSFQLLEDYIDSPNRKSNFQRNITSEHHNTFVVLRSMAAILNHINQNIKLVAKPSTTDRLELYKLFAKRYGKREIFFIEEGNKDQLDDYLT